MDIDGGGDNHPDAGIVYRFAAPSYTTPYTLTHILSAGDRANDDRFGFDLAYNGTVLAVGAVRSKTGVNGAGPQLTNAGAVYLFDGSNNFQQSQKIVLDGTGGHQRTAGDIFGSALAMDIGGSTLLIGAPAERHDVTEGTGMIPGAGSIYAYTITGATATFAQKLVATQPAPSLASDRSYNARFGYKIDLNGDPANPEAMVGAYGKILNGVPSVGRVYAITP
ncbi:MAG: hypothetical protein CVT76_08705 [Alphaproteobacteria bacterium HGW-Alphaproteobacteria-15]|nr:MAG: hypothetical protein CVT76_08705 [Alphaproteobacteria bacterium HGW-Alphaproteobacteria-15]